MVVRKVGWRNILYWSGHSDRRRLHWNRVYTSLAHRASSGVTTVIKSTVPRYGPDSLAPQKKGKSGDAVKSMYL